MKLLHLLTRFLNWLISRFEGQSPPASHPPLIDVTYIQSEDWERRRRTFRNR